MAESLKPVFGERALNKAVQQFGNSYRRQRENGKLWMATKNGMLGAVGKTKVRAHDFYGSQ